MFIPYMHVHRVHCICYTKDPVSASYRVCPIWCDTPSLMHVNNSWQCESFLLFSLAASGLLALATGCTRTVSSCDEEPCRQIVTNARSNLPSGGLN